MEDERRTRVQLEEELTALQEKQQRLQAALHDSETRLREFLDALPETVYETDAQGNLAFVNRTGLEVFGYTPEDVGRSLHPLAVFVLEDRERAQQNLRKTLSGVPGSPVEYTGLRKDGSAFPILVHANPIMRERDCIGSRGVVVDISGRKGAEAEREKLICELQQALAKIKTLRGLIPICAWCKRIRDDEGFWHQVEAYVHDHSGADFTHSLCPDCASKDFPRPRKPEE